MTALFVFVVFSVLFGQSQVSIRNVAFAEGKTLLTIYSDGQKKTVATDAKTIGEALEQNGVELGKGDVVEPSADTAINQAFYNANIYRAYPSLIIDGDTKTTVMSGYRSARQVVESSDVKLHSEDKVTIDRSDNFVSDGIIGQRIIIDRATPVEVTIGTKTFQMRTWKPNVGELLSEKGIQIMPTDILNFDVSSPITKNMKITINRLSQDIAQVTETIEPETQYKNDPNQPTSYQKVESQGVAGKKLVSYIVRQQNGVELSRQAIDTKILEPSVPKVVIRGTSSDSDEYSAKMFIYYRESKNNPSSVNQSSGACGLGQALPCSKMPCSLSDYACQDKFFTGYMQNRYGTWEKAKAFWLSNNWW